MKPISAFMLKLVFLEKSITLPHGPQTRHTHTHTHTHTHSHTHTHTYTTCLTLRFGYLSSGQVCGNLLGAPFSIQLTSARLNPTPSSHSCFFVCMIWASLSLSYGPFFIWGMEFGESKS